jgi:hypothetical protein
VPPNAIIITNRAIKDNKLSIKTPSDTLNGNNNLGKYIFFIKPSLLIKEVLDCTTAELKKFHGIIPANKNIANVLSSNLNSVAKTTAVTDIINKGFISVHKKPKAVRLYRNINCCLTSCTRT